jgi:hypothetical protein
MMINDETLAKMTPETARKIVNQMREECKCGEHKGVENSSGGVTANE